jgi:flagellar hook assembly protein FlgD
MFLRMSEIVEADGKRGASSLKTQFKISLLGIILVTVGCSGQSSSETQKLPSNSIASGKIGTFTTSAQRDSAVTKAAVWISFKNKDNDDEKCTGTLVAKGQVQTVEHCKIAKDCSNATIHYWDGSVVKTAKCDSKKSHSSPDLAILTSSDKDFLAKGIPFSFDYTKVSPTKDEEVLIYYFDSAGSLMEGSDCKIVSVSGKNFEHNCTTQKGASGALLTKIDGQTVVGIHQGNGTVVNTGTFGNPPIDTIGLHSEEETLQQETK